MATPDGAFSTMSVYGPASNPSNLYSPPSELEVARSSKVELLRTSRAPETAPSASETLPQRTAAPGASIETGAGHLVYAATETWVCCLWVPARAGPADPTVMAQLITAVPPR